MCLQADDALRPFAPVAFPGCITALSAILTPNDSHQGCHERIRRGLPGSSGCRLFTHESAL